MVATVFIVWFFFYNATHNYMATHIANRISACLCLVAGCRANSLLRGTHSRGDTKVTYFIWHPNMVTLGAISSKLSLTSRDNPVRCVRGDMLGDFDS
jgi:hypothetical protein